MACGVRCACWALVWTRGGATEGGDGPATEVRRTWRGARHLDSERERRNTSGSVGKGRKGCPCFRATTGTRHERGPVTRRGASARQLDWARGLRRRRKCDAVDEPGNVDEPARTRTTATSKAEKPTGSQGAAGTTPARTDGSGDTAPMRPPPRRERQHKHMAASDVDAQGGNARLGREARPHSAASEAWHRVRAERTGHRDGKRRTREPRQALGVKDWLKKTAAQRTEPKAWHTTNPPRRGEPKLRWGAWLSGDSRTKVSEGQQRRLGVTQGRKYCGASHATLDTAREEQQRSQLQRARRERVVARRQSEACGGGGQSNDGSARPRKGQKKGARRVVMSKAADEQGAKVTQQWRLNGKGAQGDALPCDRWRSEGREETPHGGCLRGRAESDHASTLPLAEGRAITFSNQRTASRDTRGPRHATQPQGSHTAGRKMGARTACQARSKGEALASCGEHLDKRGGSAGEKNTLQTEDRRGRRTAKRGMKKQRHDDERAALAVPWNRTMRDREVAKLDLGK
ncbi:hypothetical protein ERJ75_001135500 [Trypanosoma vivax]|nr:hypothetical protein ERJ75_001135500 [Trypanosoma vivax]